MPSQILTAAGANSQLEVVLTLSGLKNGAHDYSNIVNVSGVDETYGVNFTVPSLQYESITWALTFTSLSANPQRDLGICGSYIVINAVPQELSCNIQLFVNTSVSGELLASVGANVYQSGGANLLVPVEGALITMDNGSTVLGRTGNHSFGTSGYAQFYASPGEHVFKATKGELVGNTTVELAPLEVVNIEILVQNTSNP